MPTPRFAALLSAIFLAGTAFGQQDRATPYYNVKAGPVYFTLSSGVTTEYTDNVNLSSGQNEPIESELTITPRFGIIALSQLQLFPKISTTSAH